MSIESREMEVIKMYRNSSGGGRSGIAFVRWRNGGICCCGEAALITARLAFSYCLDCFICADGSSSLLGEGCGRQRTGDFKSVDSLWVSATGKFPVADFLF